MTLATGSAPDPYVTKEPSDATIARTYSAPDGQTQVYPKLVAGETTAIIVVGGQSLVSNYSQTVYVPTSPKVHAFNILNGGMYQPGGNPLQGCSNNLDNYWKRVADKLIGAGKYARVIIVPIGVGSMTFADFASGGQMNHRISVAGARLAAAGLTATHICWGQGESDNVLATSQATCTANLTSIVNSLKAAFGSSVNQYIATESYYLGVTAANVTNSQAAVLGGVVKAGPNLDSLNSSNRYDNVHFNATGADAAATLWNAVLP